MYIIFDLTGKKISSYEGELDESSNTRSHLLCPPNAIHAELPAGMLEDEVTLVEGVVTVDSDLVAIKAAKVKAATELTLYNAMNSDVLAQMLLVFGTSNPDSASAYKQTWDLMVSKPTMFAGKLGFADETAVVAYASVKIAEAEAYAVYRLERIAAFQVAKSLL